MKKISRILLTLAFVLVLAANVWATPITFTTDPGSSSVTVSDAAPLGTLTGTLVLDLTTFTLNDGATQALDFFTLTASGLALYGEYAVAATLAFSEPPIESEGEGGGHFFTAFGVLSAGTLTWDSSTIPDYFTLSDGNQVTIDFENGWTIGFGGTATVHAYVTNNGGAPVPEPATFILLGVGLLGLGFCGRRKMKK